MPKKKRDRLEEVWSEAFDYLNEHLNDYVEYLEIEYLNREGKTRKLSPIELMFAISFTTRYAIALEWIPEEHSLNLSGTMIHLQFSPKVYGKSGKFYYADFRFYIRKGSQPIFDDIKMLIELDGHVWHEKTPEQVEKDKQRERDLQDNGYTLYRFSGKEVYRDPDKVVDNCVHSYVERIKNG